MGQPSGTAIKVLPKTRATRSNAPRGATATGGRGEDTATTRRMNLCDNVILERFDSSSSSAPPRCELPPATPATHASPWVPEGTRRCARVRGRVGRAERCAHLSCVCVSDFHFLSSLFPASNLFPPMPSRAVRPPHIISHYFRPSSLAAGPATVALPAAREGREQKPAGQRPRPQPTEPMPARTRHHRGGPTAREPSTHCLTAVFDRHPRDLPAVLAHTRLLKQLNVIHELIQRLAGATRGAADFCATGKVKGKGGGARIGIVHRSGLCNLCNRPHGKRRITLPLCVCV